MGKGSGEGATPDSLLPTASHMGELAALLSALLWALSSAMMGSQAARVPAPVISAIRLLGATLVIWAAGAALLLAGAIEGVSAVRALALAGTGVLGPGVGDTLYIRSIPAVGLARAFPISMAAFPLFTVLLAALLVGESITLPVVIGAALIVVGTYLIGVRNAETAVDQEPSDTRRPTSDARLGIALVLGAALLWACSSVWVRVASAGVSPVLVGAIRLPAAGLLTAMVAWSAGQALWPASYGRRSLATMTAAGVLGTGAGSLLWVVGVQHAGAARTAILSSTAPLFALPLAAVFLHERITRRVAVGTVLSIAGIWLVTL